MSQTFSHRPPRRQATYQRQEYARSLLDYPDPDDFWAAELLTTEEEDCQTFLRFQNTRGEN